MTPELSRGEDAKRILQDSLFVEAWSVVERGLIDSLRTVPLTDAGLEREIVRSLQLLYRVRGHIEQVMTTGKLAALEQQNAEWRKKRAR